MTTSIRHRVLAAAAAAALCGLVMAAPAQAADAVPPTPGVACDAQSLPETVQGRVSLDDVNSGRAAQGYTCNARELGHFGVTGGFRVESYTDAAGHICGFYDTTLLFPTSGFYDAVEGTGTYVMDMTDPAHPLHVDTLRTPAMQSPHETLRLNKKRGLLAAAFSYPTFQPGVVDIYDVTADCRHPVLRSSTPLGVLGHESGFAPDGNTYYVSSLYGHTLAAVDVLDPAVPKLLWVSTDYQPHGMSLSDDGTRLYMTEKGTGPGRLTILDVTQVQQRALNPSVPIISRTTWPNVGTPQYAEPFTQQGHPYVMEVDEYGSGSGVGAGRIIDMADERHPVVISNMRLAVHQEAAQAAYKNDPGASVQFQGYKGHYCTLPTRVDPTMVACSFIVSGLRVFDITDPAAPQEIAYFNGKVHADQNPEHQGAWAMAAPAFSPRSREIWYSDGNLGFYAVGLTPAAVPFTPPPVGTPEVPISALLPVAALLVLGAAVAIRRRRAGG
jgi:MYXO-CTERM domain-containing protein